MGLNVKPIFNNVLKFIFMILVLLTLASNIDYQLTTHPLILSY